MKSGSNHGKQRMALDETKGDHGKSGKILRNPDCGLQNQEQPSTAYVRPRTLSVKTNGNYVKPKTQFAKSRAAYVKPKT